MNNEAMMHEEAILAAENEGMADPQERTRELTIIVRFSESLLAHDDGIVEHLLVEDARKVIRGAIRKERER